MRYDSRVSFIWEGDKVYNPNTSKYERDTITYESIPCNRNPLSLQRTSLEFGDVQRDISVLRLRGSFGKKVTHAIVDDIKYIVVRPVRYRHDAVFYIEAVN